MEDMRIGILDCGRDEAAALEVAAQRSATPVVARAECKGPSLAQDDSGKLAGCNQTVLRTGTESLDSWIEMGLVNKLAYARKVLPGRCGAGCARRWRVQCISFCFWRITLSRRLTPRTDANASRASNRSAGWNVCREYPRSPTWRDEEGRPFVHTYFYPAEQYDEGLVAALAEHCRQGWARLKCICTMAFSNRTPPKIRDGSWWNFGTSWRFVIGVLRWRRDRRRRAMPSCTEIGRWPIPPEASCAAWIRDANSRGNRVLCGPDHADLVLNRAQIGKINSVYECALPLDQAAPHRKGNDLVADGGQDLSADHPRPLVADIGRTLRRRKPAIENGEINEGVR